MREIWLARQSLTRASPALLLITLDNFNHPLLLSFGRRIPRDRPSSRRFYLANGQSGACVIPLFIATAGKRGRSFASASSVNKSYNVVIVGLKVNSSSGERPVRLSDLPLPK